MKIIFAILFLLLCRQAAAQYYEFYPNDNTDEFIENDLFYNKLISEDIKVIQKNHVKKLSVFLESGKLHKEVFFDRHGNFDSIKFIYKNKIAQNSIIRKTTEYGFSITNLSNGKEQWRMEIDYVFSMMIIRDYWDSVLYRKCLYDGKFLKDNKTSFTFFPAENINTASGIRYVEYYPETNSYTLIRLPEKDTVRFYVSDSLITESLRYDTVYYKIENNRLTAFNLNEHSTYYNLFDNGLIASKLDIYTRYNFDLYIYKYEYYED